MENKLNPLRGGSSQDCLPTTGGTITGTLTIDKGAYAQIQMPVNGNYAVIDANSSCTALQMKNGNDNNNRRLLVIYNPAGNADAATSLVYQHIVNGTVTNYYLYGTHNKPTAADVGAAPASHSHAYLSTGGGTITGTLLINKGAYNQIQMPVSDNYGIIEVNGSDLSLQMRNSTDNNNRRMLRIQNPSANANAATALIYQSVVNGSTATYYLYGTHNKPTAADVGALPISGGTMTGNVAYANNKGIQCVNTSGAGVASLYMSTSNVLVLGTATYELAIRSSKISISGIRDHNLTSTHSGNIYITTGNQLCLASESSRKYKKDIEDINDPSIDPHLLYEIPVRQFVYKEDYIRKEDDRYGKIVPGFIAEEVAEIYPIGADLDENGEPENWNARWIIPGMLKLIQEQNERIKKLEELILSTGVSE